MRAFRFTISFLLITLMIVSMVACDPRQPADTPGDQPDTPRDETPPSYATVTEPVTLLTSDSVTIHGDYARGVGDASLPSVLLLHMLGKDKTDYELLQGMLASEGISSLAIDIRGHGESTDDGLDYQAFTIDEWQGAVNDVAAGFQFLLDKEDTQKNKICIIGASIGANMAAKFSADLLTSGAQNPPAALVLLSPGRNYKDYRPLEFARDLRGIPVYIVASKEDGDSFETSQALSQATSGELLEFEGSVHGTNLFDTNPELLTDIVTWIKNRTANLPVSEVVDE